jgi:hypothetical protein
VVQYSAAGEYLSEWVLPGEPGGIAVGPGGQVYVTINNSHRVVQYSASGEYLAGWIVAAGRPGAIAVAPSSGLRIRGASGGAVYVTAGQNWAPNTPSSPSPAHQALGVNLPLTLSWTGGDPDGDAVVYRVYGHAATWVTSTLWYSGTDTSCAPASLLTSGITYTWRVEAADPWGGATSGPSWELTTGKYYLYLPGVAKNR